MKRGLRN